jgi:hypothetical protein
LELSLLILSIRHKKIESFLLNLKIGNKPPKMETQINMEKRNDLEEKMARISLKPQDMFRKYTDLYSAFDNNGIPTHDAAGSEISKSSTKKLQKDWEKQKKLYESF